MRHLCSKLIKDNISGTTKMVVFTFDATLFKSSCLAV